MANSGMVPNKRPNADSRELPNKRPRLLQGGIPNSSDYASSGNLLVLNTDGRLPDELTRTSFDSLNLPRTHSSQLQPKTVLNGAREGVPIENGIGGSVLTKNHQQLYQLLQNNPNGTVLASPNYAGISTAQAIQRRSGPSITFVRNSQANNLAASNTNINLSATRMPSSVQNISDDSIAIMNIKNSLTNTAGSSNIGNNILGNNVHHSQSMLSSQLIQPNVEPFANGSYMALGNQNSLSISQGINPNVSSVASHQNILEHPLSKQGAILRQSMPQVPVVNIPVSQSTGQQSSGSISISQPATPAQASAISADKHKVVQQRLVLLLHANKCQRRENQLKGKVQQPCTLPHCQTMKRLLIHMGTCSAGKSCTEPHCSISRQIIMHWKICKRADCPICVPLKQQQAAAAYQSNNTGQGIAPPDIKQTSAAPGLPLNADNNNANISSVMQQNQTIASSHVHDQVPQCSQQNVIHIPTSQTAQTSESQSQIQLRLILQNKTATTVAKQSPQNFLLTGNLPSQVKAGTVTLINSSPSQAASVVPEVAVNNSTTVTNWQQSIGQELRHYLVKKIVEVIFPATNISTIQDSRMNNIVEFAKKVETDMYHAAKSREEYYQLIAERIYKMKQELEEKRQKRIEMHLQQQQQQHLQQQQQQQHLQQQQQHLQQQQQQQQQHLQQQQQQHLQQQQQQHLQQQQQQHLQQQQQQQQQAQSTKLPVSVSQPYLPNPAVQDVEQKRASPNVKMQAMASGNLEFFSASGSQLSKSQSPIINMAANQLNQSQSRLSPLLSVDLQQLPSLSTSTGPVITMSSVSTNVTTVPTTAENIPVSQYNSVFQSGFSQVTDAARDKQIDIRINQQQQPSEHHLNLCIKSESSLSPQMQTQATALHIAQLSAPQPQSPQTNVQQSPQTSFPRVQLQLSESQPQQNSQQIQIQRHLMQTELHTESVQSFGLNNDDIFKPLVSSSQEGVTSMNQTDTNQPSTTVSDQQPKQTQMQYLASWQQPSQSHLSLYTSKFELGLSPQMLSHSTTLQISQSPQTPVHQSPHSSSVPGTSLQTPPTPKSQENYQQNEVCPQLLHMQPPVLSVKDNSEVVEPVISSSQDSIASMSKTNIYQQNTSPQKPSNSVRMPFPQSSTPQPHSQQTPVQQSPRPASVPEMHLQTSNFSQSPQNSQQNEVQLSHLQLQPNQAETSVKPTQLSVFENESFKPVVSVSQNVTSVNQTNANQSCTPTLSASDNDCEEKSGKMFSYVSQKSAEESKCVVKMEVDEDVKSESIKSETVMDSTANSKVEVKMEIKQESIEDGGYATGSSTTEEAVTIKEEPQSTAAMEASSDSKSCSSSEPATVQKPNKKIFKPDELRHALMPTLENLYKQDPESLPFRQPVDPEYLQIPDYFDIVKRPMDLSTIKRKLDTGQYQEPWQYIEDVCLVFENAWLYNKKTSRVYRHASKLAEVFAQEIDPVMRSLGYCCGQKYVFQPQDLCCYGKDLCIIPRDTKYWSYQNKYTYCAECFTEIPGDTISLVDDPTQPPINIKKDQFIEMKNNYLEQEPFVDCSDCGRKFHQICALHFERIWPEGFTCNNCLKTKGKRRKDNKFTAKKLQQTRLGQYIEMRVNNFLKKKESGAGEVTVRVVSSSQKYVEVKPGMKARYVDSGEWPNTFPYTAKALFAFEEIDGVDTCFFGMHVQEYGSDCPMPNTRRVYIAYLDSVHFFQPKQYRTAVYHEILLGYLEYAKQLGYAMAHIWACPPSEGDDFIFHCHPPEQKFPKPKRLQDWYKKMLDKGIMDRTVMDYKDILKQAIEDNLINASALPYFEGDFWPNALEEGIKELENEEKEKKKTEAAEAEAAAMVLQACDAITDGENSIDCKKKGQKSGRDKKSSKSKNNQRKNNKKLNVPCTSDDLSHKIYSTMEKHKEVFFVIRLHSVQAAVSLPPIVDPDQYISCDMMDGRDAFLTLCKEKHYEFSSLRRTKFSTMAMLYELHNQGQDRFVYTCNNCKQQVETRYHCTVCDDFDLCASCFAKDGHNHKMEKLGFGLDDDSAAQTNSKGSEMPAAQRCIKNLVHACQCRDANCRLPSCQKMKRVLQHAKTCKKRATNGNCHICKQLIRLCCCHAKYCQEAKCPVLFCINIKYKLNQQQIQRRVQQAQILRNRIATMQNRGASSTVAQAIPKSSNSSSQPSPDGQVHLSLHSPQSSIGMKPPAGPPVGALQAVQQIQATAARQTAPHAAAAFTNYGKKIPNVSLPASNTGAMTTAQPIQTQVRKPVSQIMSGIPNRIINMGNVRSWESSGYAHNLQTQPQHASQTIIRQPSQIMRPSNMANCGNPTLGPSQSIPNAGPRGNMRFSEAYQQLLQTLKSASTPQQQQRVLAIFKANPDLMSYFIKQRATNQQQQSQQMTTNKGNAIPSPHQNVSLNQQQQHLLGMQRQEQQFNKFLQPQPPMYPQHQQMSVSENFGQQGFQSDNTQLQFQKQPQTKLMASSTYPSGSLQQDIIVHQQSVFPLASQQQLSSFSQCVKSPPPYAVSLTQPVHSPQPAASPRTQNHPTASPRQQPVPSPHYPVQTLSPHQSLPSGTSGHSGSDQIVNNDMMRSHLTNPAPSNSNAANQLQSPANQEPDLSCRDGGLVPLAQNEQLDKYIQNL